ncbi:MAG: hypothetical protein ACRD1P_02565, partial [Thermoanaerobaculia bacterium]
ALNGTTYVFYTWRDGTLMSVRQADVRKVTRLTGLPAFKVQQEELGAALIDNLPMEGGTSQVISTDSGAAARPGPTRGTGNWTYQGVPGATDAYAPANATVASPGDVPKAAPAPTPPPH